jgi:hypothetical protein
MFEHPVTAVGRWNPSGDPGCPEDDYTDLDLDQWAADLWAERMLGRHEDTAAHCCGVGCEKGCVRLWGDGPRDEGGDGDALSRQSSPLTSSGSAIAPGDEIAQGTAYIASQVS